MHWSVSLSGKGKRLGSCSGPGACPSACRVAVTGALAPTAAHAGVLPCGGAGVSEGVAVSTSLRELRRYPGLLHCWTHFMQDILDL